MTRTHGVQTRNKRSNMCITAFGETKILADWLTDSRCKVPVTGTIVKRLATGWTPEDAISLPSRSRPAKKRAPKTKCVNGHDFTPDNTRIDLRGAQQCITCGRQRARAWYHKNKGAS